MKEIVISLYKKNFQLFLATIKKKLLLEIAPSMQRPHLYSKIICKKLVVMMKLILLLKIGQHFITGQLREIKSSFCLSKLLNIVFTLNLFQVKAIFTLHLG